MSSLDQSASAKPRDDAEEDMIEHLRCYYCKGYLSCSPLRLLPDGYSICSRCEPPNNDVPVYRMLAVENAMAKVTFPCCFQDNGCSIHMLFGHIFDHERVCEYQTFTCFAAALQSCSWKGRSFDISRHFSEKHQEYWMEEKQQFRVVVEEDSKQDLLVFEKQNVLTMIKYSYNSAKKILEYCIQYLPVNVGTPGVFYNIELHNIADRTPHITIKNVPCLYQQAHAKTPNTLSKIMLEPYEDILESPDIIVFFVNMMFEERLPCSEKNKRTWDEMMFEGVKSPASNCCLKSLKCVLCGIYATPPLFKDSEGELVCTDCGQNHKDCTSYEDEKMETIMGEVNYPCRWVRCNVTKKVDSIRQHEKNCQYRVFKCVLVNCNKVYKRGRVLEHFNRYHCGYKHVEGRMEFDVDIALPHKKQFFLVKDDEAFIIEFTCKDELSRKVFVLRQTPPLKTSYISAYVQHKLCKWRSMDYCLPVDFNITDTCCYKYYINLTTPNWDLEDYTLTVVLRRMYSVILTEL